MSEDVIRRIKVAEEEAEALIHAAKKRAHTEINEAVHTLEREIRSFQETSEERLKRFRDERVVFYKAEAERIREEGRKMAALYQAKMEEAFPNLKEKVGKLIKKELCL